MTRIECFGSRYPGQIGQVLGAMIQSSYLAHWIYCTYTNSSHITEYLSPLLPIRPPTSFVLPQTAKCRYLRSTLLLSFPRVLCLFKLFLQFLHVLSATSRPCPISFRVLVHVSFTQQLDNLIILFLLSHHQHIAHPSHIILPPYSIYSHPPTLIYGYIVVIPSARAHLHSSSPSPIHIPPYPILALSWIMDIAIGSIHLQNTFALFSRHPCNVQCRDLDFALSVLSSFWKTRVFLVSAIASAL